MIYSVVSMVIKPERMDEFLEECKKVRPLVLREAGCLMYDYTREIASGDALQEAFDPNRVTLYEKWASPEALKAHNGQAYMKTFVSKLAPMRERVITRIGTEAF